MAIGLRENLAESEEILANLAIIQKNSGLLRKIAKELRNWTVLRKIVDFKRKSSRKYPKTCRKSKRGIILGMAQDKGFVSLVVTSNVNSFQSERRFPTTINVGSLKGKLELLTGVMMSSMKLELRDNDDEVLKALGAGDDALTLAQLGVVDGHKIHVIDTADKEPDDDDADVAFKLSTEEYEQREESMRKFLEKNKLGRFDEAKAARKAAEEEAESALASELKSSVGSRTEVRIPGAPPRRGVIKFVGPVNFKGGDWVGVAYDEPVGKNDGSVGGVRFFEAKPKYGSFVRPSNVTIGDFPPEDDGLDEI